MSTNDHFFCFLRPIGYFCCLLLGFSSQPIEAACDLFRNFENAPGLALVIGNSQYKNGTLKQPVNDARKMKTTLEKMGFEVSFQQNLNERQINDYTHRFSDCLTDNQRVGLFYFSGHGTQVVEQIYQNQYKSNYLLPINNTNILDEEDVKRKAFPVKTLLNRLKKARNQLNIVILDANRRNPYSGGLDGLAVDIHYSGNFIIAYPSRTAINENGSKNSLYVTHLTAQLEQATITNRYIEEVFRAVTQSVAQQSGWWQQPHFQSSLTQDFCFWACQVSLTIRTSPDGEGALVIIDGKKYGYLYNSEKTVKLPIGSHTIQLKTTGKNGISHTVEKKINLTQTTEEYIPVRVINGSNGSVVIRPKDPTELQKVSSVAFSPNSRYVLSGGQDRKLWLWDFNRAKLNFVEGHSDLIGSVSFSSDGRYALSGSRDRKVLLWEVNQGQLRRLHTYRGHSGFVSSVSFSSDNRYALSASYDKTVRVWDIGNRSLVRRIKDSGWDSDWILSADLSPNRDDILSGSRKKIRLWDFSGQLRHSFSGREYFHSVKFFPDGQKLVSGSSDNTVRVWEVNSGNLWRTFWGHSESVLAVDISSDASYIVSGSKDNTVRLWDVNSGQSLHIFKEPSNNVNSVTFSQSGDCILSGGDDGIYLWNTQTQRLIARMMVFTDNDWVIMIPSTGFFAASARGGQKLSIRVGGNRIRNNASFNNPALVQAELTNGCQ